MPAAYCDMSAIKPSAGRIPHRGYAGGTNSCVGPMANTMVDCSKLYSIMAGPDFTDESKITWYQPKVEVPKTVSTKSPFTGLKVGVDFGWIKEADDDVQEAFQKKIEEIEKAGAEIVSVQVPDIMNMHVAHYVTFTQEISAQIQQYFEDVEHVGLGNVHLCTNCTNYFCFILTKMSSLFWVLDMTISKRKTTVLPSNSGRISG